MSTRDKLRENINYVPYCMCSTMGRMTRTEKGFKCDPFKMDHFRRTGCGHSFEFDDDFLKELKSLGWDNAEAEREGIAEEMDEILINLGIKRRGF